MKALTKTVDYSTLSSMLHAQTDKSMSILLYLGSFNPIHNGHLQIAETALHMSGNDEVWFVVSPQNPFKQNEDLLPEKLRLQMVSESIGIIENFQCCDIEFNLPRPSFTIDTLRALFEKYPQHKFSLLLGSDNLLGFERWKETTEIQRHCKIYIYPRIGYENRGEEGGNFEMLETTLLDISATQIRELKKAGMPFGHMVPEPVLRLWC